MRLIELNHKLIYMPIMCAIARNTSRHRISLISQRVISLMEKIETLKIEFQEVKEIVFFIIDSLFFYKFMFIIAFCVQAMYVERF